MAATKGVNVGIHHVQIAFRKDTGEPMGQETDPNNVSNGTTSSAYKVDGAIDFTPEQLTTATKTNKGGQIIISKTPMGVTDYGAATLVLSQYDEQFFAYISGTSVDETTDTTMNITGTNVNQRVPPAFVVIVSSRFTDSSGSDKYMNYIYPNAFVTPVGDANMTQIDADVTNDTPYTYQIVPSASSSTGFGYTFANTALNVVDDSDIRVKIISDYPLGLTTYVDDGAAGTFTLGYLPTSSDETGGAGNIITSNGTKTAVTSVATATGLVTQTAAGTAADIWVVAYPTQFQTP